jgi:hypothetical protein
LALVALGSGHLSHLSLNQFRRKKFTPAPWWTAVCFLDVCVLDDWHGLFLLEWSWCLPCPVVPMRWDFIKKNWMKHTLDAARDSWRLTLLFV